MSQHVYVLCSKYSESCKEFMNIVNKYNIDIIRPVYIDNSISRKLVEKSPLNIKLFPCILGSLNGYIAIYEGKDAFDWLNEISKSYIQPQSIDKNIEYGDTEPDKLNAHVDHKIIDNNSIVEKMRKEREQDDNLLHDKKRAFNPE